MSLLFSSSIVFDYTQWCRYLWDKLNLYFDYEALSMFKDKIEERMLFEYKWLKQQNIEGAGIRLYSFVKEKEFESQCSFILRKCEQENQQYPESKLKERKNKGNEMDKTKYNPIIFFQPKTPNRR